MLDLNKPYTNVVLFNKPKFPQTACVFFKDSNTIGLLLNLIDGKINSIK